MVTKDGRELFSGQDISLIYTKINESHLILFDNCSKTELKELDEIFGTESFIEIEQYLFIPLLTELAQLTTKDGMPRFNSSEIVKVLNTSNEILNQILKVFVGLTTKDGILRFDNEGTVGCALHFKQKFIKTVIKLAQETIKDGKLKFDFDEIIKLASLSKTQFDAIKKLAKMTTKDGTAKFSLIDIMLLSEKSSIIENFEEIDSKVNAQVQLMLKEPEKYINGGDYQTVAEMQQVIQDYYCLDFGVIHLYIAASIFDKDSLNNLMRMRLDNAKVYMNSMLLMDDKKHQLLKDLCNTRNIKR